MKVQRSTERREAFAAMIRFFVVGVSGTLLYAGIAYGAHAAGLSAFPAHIIASAISLIYSYIAQKTFTYRVKGAHKRMAPRFVVATAGLVLTQSALVLCLSHFGVAEKLVLLASTLFYPPASFLTHTFWTFRK